MIPQDLIASYRNANYQIGITPESFIVQIDQYSAPLSQFLTQSDQCCAAIISAYNPGSRLLNDEENLAAHESLRNLLKQYPCSVIESLHADPAGAWPAEKSFFIPGMDLSAAKRLGRQFNQNAIVWSDRDAIPRLILLR